MIVKICSLFLSRQLTVGTKFHNMRPQSVAENNPLHTMLLTSTSTTSRKSTRSATIFTSSTLTGEEMQDLLAFQALLRKEDELMKYTRSKQKQDEMRSKHDSTYNGSSTVPVRLRGLIAQQMSSMAMPTSTLVLVSILQLGNTQTPMPTTFLQPLPVLDAQTLLPMRRVITCKCVENMVHKEATALSKRRKRIVEDEN